MSRAVVEDAHPNLVTPRGLKLIDDKIVEINDRLAERPDDLAVAWLQRDLRYWQARRANAQVIDPPPDPSQAGFATRVTFRRQGAERETVEIVGEDEADPAEHRLAYVTPIAQALMGAEPGETVFVEDPPLELTLIKVEPL